MTRDEVLALLDLPIRSAAVGAALELGLFWRIEVRPLPVNSLAAAMGIAAGRCAAWLRVLADAGLVEESADGFGPTEVARRAILGSYSRDSWRMLAQEARERVGLLADLPDALGRPASATAERTAAYVEMMARDPARAARFTRMLFELHRDLAGKVAASIDLAGGERILDLGGGSGVVALALSRRWPGVSVTVLDIATVCDEGRRLVAHEDPGARIDFQPGNFLSGELPGGFDLVLECDVAIFSAALFEKIRRALVPGGRFVVVDQLAEGEGSAPQVESGRALVRTLGDPDWRASSLESVGGLMVAAGFCDLRRRSLGSGPGVGGLEADAVMLEGRIPV